MLKYSSFLLLIAVAISWSEVECSLYHARYAHLFARGIAKRSAEEDTSELTSAEAGEILMKGFLAGVLELTAENSAERQQLSERFEKELEHRHESLDDYAEHISKIYEEVTGRNPDDDLASDSESDETSVNEA